MRGHIRKKGECSWQITLALAPGLTGSGAGISRRYVAANQTLKRS